MMRSFKQNRSLIIGLLLLLLSAGLCAFAEQLLTRLDRLMPPNPQCSWLPTDGNILGSDLENHIRPNGEDDWQFGVRFSYVIHGVEYWRQQQLSQELVVPPDVAKFAKAPYLFTACDGLPGLSKAIALFRAAHDESGFFRDRPVVVYYNPANERDAVLIPGLLLNTPMSYGEGIMVYVMALLPLAGIVMIVKGIGNRLK